MPDPARHAARALDALAFSGGWAALAAGALTAACAAALAAGRMPASLAPLLALSVGGTFVVYSVDRLRDVRRDAESSPERSGFIAHHRNALVVATAAAALACIVAAIRLPASIWLVCAAVLGLGLWHRRLKARRGLAHVYVSLSWVAIVLGLPAMLIPRALDPRVLLAAALGLGLAITANAMASELRGALFDAAVAERLRLARRTAAASIVPPLLGGAAAPLALVGAAVWLSLAFFRPGERYGLIVLDGALLVGAVGAVIATRL